MTDLASHRKTIGTMALILVAALAVTSVHHPIQRWGASEALTLSVSSLSLAWLATLFQKPPHRWFWLGFGAFGTFYLTIAIFSPWGEHLPTTSFLDRVHERASPPLEIGYDDSFGEESKSARVRRESFRTTGNSVLSLAIGLMGGLLALLVMPKWRESEANPPRPM